VAKWAISRDTQFEREPRIGLSEENTLNDKQNRFAAEYLVDLNATQAAIRAGYSKRSAYSQGQRLLKNAEVALLVEAGRQRIAARLEVTANRVVEELARIGFANMGDFIRIDEGGGVQVDLSNAGRAELAAVKTVTVEHYVDRNSRKAKRVKIKLWDKATALAVLVKHLNLYADGFRGSPQVARGVKLDVDAMTEEQRERCRAALLTLEAMPTMPA
jgi:phage terminase small subunit